MKNKQWEAIHEVYSQMEKLCGRSLYLPEDRLHPLRETAAADKTLIGGADVCSADDLIRIRSELRNQLDYLKSVVAQQYSERDTYIILFPIVAQIDELIQVNFLRSMNLTWPLLQKELFQIDNAGDVFYEILDDILQKPQTYPFIFEVYYFCMRYGFRGRYENNPVKFGEYLKKLQAKLDQEEWCLEPPPEQEMGYLRQFAPPYKPYLISGGVLLFAFILFTVLARMF